MTSPTGADSIQLLDHSPSLLSMSSVMVNDGDDDSDADYSNADTGADSDADAFDADSGADSICHQAPLLAHCAWDQ